MTIARAIAIAYNELHPAETAFVDDDVAFMVVLLEHVPPGGRFAFASISGRWRWVVVEEVKAPGSPEHAKRSREIPR